MNKQDLINAVAASTDLPKAKAKEVVESVFDNIRDGLIANGEAAFVGFGTFKVSHRAARPGRNPQTGESIQIAASKSVLFKPSKAVKEAVN